VGTITHESIESSGNLVEQIWNRCGVAYFRNGEFARQNLMIFIDCKMQSTPGAPSRNIMFFLMPFVFAIDLESGEINNYDTTGFLRLSQDSLGKVMLRLEMLLKPGFSFHDTGKRIHQAFGLA